MEKAREYFKTSRKPVVVKPSRGRGGNEIYVGVETDAEFDTAWSAVSASRDLGGAVLIEEQVSGIDLRAFVVDGKCRAISTRLPAFVVGDGSSTLGQLVERSQIERKKNAYLRGMPIKPDWNWLSKTGVSETSVVPLGKIQILTLAFNLHQGGVSLDMTDRVEPAVVEVAERAAKAIPGLKSVGVDLMVSESVESPVRVLEANTAANIAVHHYPTYGSPRPVAEHIIDLLAQDHRPVKGND